jgi:hypothetical protein
MIRKLFVFGVLLGLVGSVVTVIGCGQSQQETTTTPAPSGQTISISGTATASQSDLAYLGVTALAVGTPDQTAYLKALGVSDARLYGIVRPMAVSGATCTLKYINSDGSYTSTSTTAEVRNGMYTLEAAASTYDSSKQYVVTISKTSSDKGKTLEMNALVGSISNNKATVPIDAKADLVAKTIINQVVKVLKSAKVDASVISQVQDAIISVVNAMVEAGTISIPSMVREATETENQSANSVADAVAETGQAKFAIEAVKTKTSFAKVSTTEEAKGVIKEIFAGLMGDPRFIPGEVISGLAKQLLAGSTKTFTQFASALDSNLRDTSNQAVSGRITASGVINSLTEKLTLLYGTSTTGKISNIDDARKAAMIAVFPREIWGGKSIVASDTVTVPQMIVLMELAFRIVGNQYILSPAQAMNSLFPNLFEDKVKIMHAEVRIASYFDPQNPTAGDTAALDSFLAVGNMLKEFSSTEVQGVTATLTYPKAGGLTGVASYQAFTPPSGGGGKGPEPEGMKKFVITPFNWGGGATREVISNFIAGTATIKVYKSNLLVNSKEVAIVDTTNFRKIRISFNVPKQSSHPTDIDVFPTGSQPVFTWTVTTDSSASVASMVPSGYRLAYSLMIFQQGTFGRPFFNSFDKQKFIDGTSFPIASAGTFTEGNYFAEILPVLLEENGRFPVAEGKRTHTNFKVGTAAEVSTQIGTITIEGTVTPASSSTLSKIRVGIFFGGTWTDKLSPIVPAVSLDSNKKFKITVALSNFSSQGRYEVRAWEDDGDGKLHAPPAGSEVFSPSRKDIFKEMQGLMTFDPAIQQRAPLKERPTGFDMTMFLWEN